MNQLRHLVIIPDGNRRYARKRGLKTFFGHDEGAKKLEEILNAVLELEIPCFTFWGSSLDNAKKRPREEVDFLFRVFERYFTRLLNSPELEENETKVSIIGRWRELFPENLKKLFEKIIGKTRNYDKFRLNFLMAYGGLDEMTEAIKKITEAGKRNPDLGIDEKLIKDNLWTRDLPPVDLVIRTGGEPHWSAGLMMWDVADSQLYFTETLWPEFTKEEFFEAIRKFQDIERRFGK